MATLSPPPPYLSLAANRGAFTAIFARRNTIISVKGHQGSKHQRIRASALHDYFQQSTHLLTKSDGGPPRWFSPLECAFRFDKSPLLLTLPGMDGNGYALLLHYQRLGQIFDIWCLHIPTTDRTPFTGVPSRMMMATVEKGLPFQQTTKNLSEDVAAWVSYISGLAGVFTVETILWKLKMLESAYEYSNSHILGVPAQTLILSSGKDQLLPNLVEGQRLSQILPKCQMRIFNDCGHALFLEEDVDLVAVIKEADFYHRAVLLPPSPFEIRKCVDSLRWTDVAASPVFLSTLENEKIVRGLDGIPTEGPVLFVGHHNILGFEMIPMLRHFLIEGNINVRILAHPLPLNMFKQVPDMARYNFLRVMGAVPVSASNMYQLFSMKSHALLYPGGVREGLHRKLVFDYNDQIKIPFLKAYMDILTNQSVKLRTDAEAEFANQDMHVPGLLPKVPGRYYYLFGKPIETQDIIKFKRFR